MEPKRRRIEPRATAAALKQFVSALNAHEPALRDRVFAFLQPAIDRRRFSTAASAFNNFNASSVSFANLAKKKLRALKSALDSANVGFYQHRFYRGFNPKFGSSIGALMHQMFSQEGPARLSSKTWKCVKIRDSMIEPVSRVCFFSDAYEFNDVCAMELALCCNKAGLAIQIFEWAYPGLDFKDGYFLIDGIDSD